MLNTSAAFHIIIGASKPVLSRDRRRRSRRN